MSEQLPSNPLCDELRALAPNLDRRDRPFLYQAADEIERLQAELDLATASYEHAIEVRDQLRCDLDRLRAALKYVEFKIRENYSVMSSGTGKDVLSAISEALAGAADETTGEQS